MSHAATDRNWFVICMSTIKKTADGLISDMPLLPIHNRQFPDPVRCSGHSEDLILDLDYRAQ